MRRKRSDSFKGGAQRVGALVASACLVGGAAVGIIANSQLGAGADTVGPTTFEGFSNGSVHGQNGWSSSGSFDQEIVTNNGLAPASFGTKSLRISDAVTSGAFGNQTFSKPTANQAGEPTAETGGYPVGTLQNVFKASFNFASATPSTYQPGLHMSVSPDRGDGARMSYVRIEDTPTGFKLYFDPYVDAAPLATPGNLNDGCGAEDGWPDILISDDLSRGAHNLQFVMKLVNGPHNDLVTVLLDGDIVAAGPSWEDYFRDCAESGGGDGGPNANQSRTVRNLEFRESSTANPGNAGKGFLIDGVSQTTISLPGAPRQASGVPGNGSVKLSWTAPANLAGNPINGYVITPIKAGVPQPAQTFNSAATTQVIAGLTNGTTYTFKIAAKNDQGTGSAATSGGVTAGAPGRPGKVKAVNAGAGKLKVTFTAPVTNGAAISQYVTLCKSSNGGVAVTKAGTKSPLTATGATVGKSYTCTVLAKNSRGSGPKSQPSTPAAIA